ncbi:hypothetical protein [Methylorubrum populi]|uniref:hypothetical protein n=1 Tax=Methylorubrum populi TaxID=223967 RepID=UPI0012646BE1|nr:hypothetical protein [Methylorubrum populi]
MNNKRKSECTPEEWEALLARRREDNRKWRATESGKEKGRAYRAKKVSTPEGLEKERKYRRDSAKRNRATTHASRRRWEAANPEIAARYRRQYNWKRLSPKASKRKTRELMEELARRAPRHHGREEIIASATMFVLEGDTIEAALAKASKAHNADVRIQNSSTNFEEAYWL